MDAPCFDNLLVDNLQNVFFLTNRINGYILKSYQIYFK